ncbi:MAG: WYL domain-containing protein, partial [Dehalococcoidales bacterium]|nr:WYL domain-containing protein [Dehalococcoidales bacterium]
DFLTKFQYRKSEQRYALEDKVAVIQQAIRDGALLRIVYLKPSDEKTRRTIHPCAIGEMEFQGKTYLGVRAFCLKRNAERTFRVDRMLDITVLPPEQPVFPNPT